MIAFSSVAAESLARLKDTRMRKSAKKATDKSKGNKPGGETVVEVLDVMPLETAPPSELGDGPAPHLPLAILRGVAEGFLHIQPESVSAALIQKDILDE